MKTASLAIALYCLTACGAGAPDAPTASETASNGVAISSGSSADCTSRAYPNIGGPISLTAHTGERVTQDTFKGRYSLIYFGFTYCPDVCPMTLSTVARAYDMLPESVTPPQTLLISIDPERDTPEALATYVTTKVFPDNLIGLTGTASEVRAAADAFVSDYTRIEQPDSMAEYTMDHTSLLYLMDENWQLKSFFTHEDTAETISDCLKQVLGED